MLTLARLLASRFGTQRVFKERVSSPESRVLSAGPVSRVFSFQDGSRFGPQNEAPIRPLVGGGQPQIAANLLSQKWAGISVRVVTEQSDGKHEGSGKDLVALLLGEVFRFRNTENRLLGVKSSPIYRKISKRSHFETKTPKCFE
jgi:hypothetical protein